MVYFVSIVMTRHVVFVFFRWSVDDDAVVGLSLHQIQPIDHETL